jgi:hypothetical protein
MTPTLSPFTIMLNARSICSSEFDKSPNWYLATWMFAVGHTTAVKICRDAGIDPDAFTITRKI